MSTRDFMDVMLDDMARRVIIHAYYWMDRLDRQNRPSHQQFQRELRQHLFTCLREWVDRERICVSESDADFAIVDCPCGTRLPVRIHKRPMMVDRETLP